MADEQPNPNPFAIENDTRIYPMLAELSACLCAGLGDGKPCFCGVLVGNDLPVDYVGACADENGDASCGVAYVRVVGAFPTSSFPEPMVNAGCNTLMAYNIAVGVLRCWPVGEEDGGPVDPDELRALSLDLLTDMNIIRKAIQCCFLRAFPNVSHVMGTYQPLSVEGGVAGGEWPITVLEATDSWRTR